jgi:hypothetical protein
MNKGLLAATDAAEVGKTKLETLLEHLAADTYKD